MLYTRCETGICCVSSPSKATRKFHKPNTRIQETMNEVLARIASSERQAVLAEPENALPRHNGKLPNQPRRPPRVVRLPF